MYPLGCPDGARVSLAPKDRVLFRVSDLRTSPGMRSETNFVIKPENKICRAGEANIYPRVWQETRIGSGAGLRLELNYDPISTS